jgi:protein-tyrosine phosphatase
MNSTTSQIGVLFVCTGNICRSPTAEAIFTVMVKEAGLSHMFHIDSAGTHGYHVGDPPDQRAVAVALQRGIDMRDLRARKIVADDFTRFNHIYAMDSGHFRLLEKMNGKGRISMFTQGRDVADPYYGAMRDFELAYDHIQAGCLELIKKLSNSY